MFKKLFLLSVVILSTINVTKSYACQTNGCSGYVYGPVVAAYVSNYGDDLYIGAAIKNTDGIDNAVESGADDDACNGQDYVLGKHWGIVMPFGVDSQGRPTRAAAANSQAMLDMLRESQKHADTQVMIIFYTWSEARTSCIMTGVGYYNG